MARRLAPFCWILVVMAGVGCERGVPGAAPEAGTAVVVADTPALRIGVLEGDSAYQLYNVRAIRRLSDGRILVADGGHRLRLYGPDGSFERGVGGPGEGPGEFRSIDFVAVLPGDSILVFDRRLGRATVFTHEGTLARGFRPGQEGGAAPGDVVGLLEDRTLLVRTGPIYAWGEATAGAHRDSSAYYRVDLDGAPVGPVGRFPSTDTYVALTSSSMSVMMLLLGRQGLMVAAGDRLYFGDTGHPDIVVLHPSGAVLDTVRTSLPARRVTDELVERAREARLAGYDDDASRQRAMTRFASMPPPEHLPFYDQLHVDERGLLWLKEYHVAEDSPATWRILSSDGSPLGSVTLPASFSIHEIGVDYVLGRARNALDVEFVHLYPLERPPG